MVEVNAVEYKLLSKRQVAKIARVDAQTVNLWLALGLLPAIPVSPRRIKVPLGALEALLEGKKVDPAGQGGER
jgi:hypothetical protein